MNENSRVVSGAVIGAIVGALASYVFFTERGRAFRERMEPMVDDLRGEFARFERTIQKLGAVANEGMRAVGEFNAARMHGQHPGERTSH